MPSLILALSTAYAGDFVDVAVTTALQDTNVRAGPEHFSPGPNFVQRGTQTFFENYEGRYTDDISQSHLVLYRRDDGFNDKWFTEAAFVLQFTPYLDPDNTDPGVDLRDDGSYVRVARELEGEDHTISLTGYAVDAGRFRLGYSYDLSYGGKEIVTPSVGAMPGARLQWQKDGNYLFAGGKSAINQSVDPSWAGNRNSAYYALLAGGGVTLQDKLRLEAGIGSFQQGQMLNVRDASQDIYGALIKAFGASGQIAFRTTDELQFIQSGELRLYRNSPDHVRETYISHNQVENVGFMVQAEANRLVHNLLDADNDGAQINEVAWAGDVQARLVFRSTSIAADVVYKDLPYILFNVPGFTSGTSIPSSLETTPQTYGRLTVSHYFPDARVAPSLGLGLLRPATYTDPESGNIYVQYSDRDKEQVPEDYDRASDILGSVLGVQYDISPSTIAVGELLYTVDNNLSRSVANDAGDLIRVAEPDEVRQALGFNIMLRARF
ncbi:MAG: hypothetical protein GY913_25870 [Proteobacteria bacterium]|nr:hypothetical protein [Pseudomonadota bacterium]MCP4920344.1 hypothetical protein [Pseudomonadota bacterium]